MKLRWLMNIENQTELMKLADLVQFYNFIEETRGFLFRIVIFITRKILRLGLWNTSGCGSETFGFFLKCDDARFDL